MADAEPAPQVRAIVLAAGAGSRFGADKLAARVDGLPLLAHVLLALRDAGLGVDPVVVVPPASDRPAGSPLDGVDIRVNPRPADGLSSSLRIGFQHAMAHARQSAPPDALLVCLGDQPLIRPDVIRALAAAPLDPSRPIVAPRYALGGGRNPVRLESAAATLVEAGTGDRGLGPTIEAHPELVRTIEVDGDNPDVDSVADLASVADAMWASRVRRNREQVDRFREEPDGADFYSSVSSIFRDDPDRTDDAVLDALRARTRPGDTWLDIGAGAGRYALPLARAVRRVLALDPSRSMLAGLRESMADHAIRNIEVVEGRWPAAHGQGSVATLLPADVSLIAHVGYDIEEVWPFLAAMERATARECIALLMQWSPASVAEPFWPPVHGERRISLPALPAFVDLLAAHGREPDVQLLDGPRRRWSSRDELEGFLRRQTWVSKGSAKDGRLQAELDARLEQARDGSVELAEAEPLQVGLVAWTPLERAEPAA